LGSKAQLAGAAIILNSLLIRTASPVFRKVTPFIIKLHTKSYYLLSINWSIEFVKNSIHIAPSIL